jgi:hypothetical protein
MEGTPGIPGGDPRFVEMNDRVREGLRKAGMREGERPRFGRRRPPCAAGLPIRAWERTFKALSMEGALRPERSANRGSRLSFEPGAQVI